MGKMITRRENFKAKVIDTLPPKNLLPLLFSYTLDHVGLSIYFIFLSPWLSELSPYLSIIALVMALPGMVSVLGTSFFSSLSDRTGRRKELLLLARIASSIQYVLLIFFQQTIWNILAILVSFGILIQMYYPLHSALITSICHPDRRGQVASFQTIFASLGWMIGSSVSGIIESNLSYTGSLIIAACFALVSGSLAMFSPTKSWEARQLEKAQEELNEGISDSNIDEAVISAEVYVKQELIGTRVESIQEKTSYFDIFKRKKILLLLLTLAIVDFGYGPFSAINTLYLLEVGLTENMVSISNAIATFFGMVILLVIGKLLDNTGRKPFLVFSILMYPIVYSSMWIFSSFPWAVFAIYLFPLYAIKVPTSYAIISDLTKENERARGMSLIQYEQIFTQNIGAIIACVIADFVPSGIFIIPVFPIVFGIVSLLVAIFLVEETNKKFIDRKTEEKRKLSANFEQEKDEMVSSASE
jgi:MFS family permease